MITIVYLICARTRGSSPIRSILHWVNNHGLKMEVSSSKGLRLTLVISSIDHTFCITVWRYGLGLANSILASTLCGLASDLQSDSHILIREYLSTHNSLLQDSSTLKVAESGFTCTLCYRSIYNVKICTWVYMLLPWRLASLRLIDIGWSELANHHWSLRWVGAALCLECSRCLGIPQKSSYWAQSLVRRLWLGNPLQSSGF